MPAMKVTKSQSHNNTIIAATASHDLQITRKRDNCATIAKIQQTRLFDESSRNTQSAAASAKQAENASLLKLRKLANIPTHTVDIHPYAKCYYSYCCHSRYGQNWRMYGNMFWYCMYICRSVSLVAVIVLVLVIVLVVIIVAVVVLVLDLAVVVRVSVVAVIRVVGITV